MTRAAGKFGLYGRTADDDPDGAVSLLGSLATPALRPAAVDVVQARVAAVISLGMLTPGQRLPDPEALAASFEVSTITVRRALEALCREGILGRRRGRSGGTFVADRLDPALLRRIAGHDEAIAELGALVEQRMLIECGIAALVAMSGPRADLPVTTAGLEAPPDSLAAAEIAFHTGLAGLCGLPAAPAHVRSAIQQVAAYLPPWDEATARRLAEEHEALVEAISAGDVAKAVELTRAHLERLHRLDGVTALSG